MKLSSPKVTIGEDPPCPLDPDKLYPEDQETVLIWTRNEDRRRFPRSQAFIWLEARYHAKDNSWRAKTAEDDFWVHDSEVLLWKRP